MLARSPLFEKFSLQRNFQGLLSIVQLSRFLSFSLCDSFDILSNLFRFVKNFFIFLFCPLRFPLGPLQATACIDYHISSALSTTFFHLFFQRFQLPFSAPRTPVVPPPRLRQCLTSAVSRCCPQRQVLSYHLKKELSMFFLFFIYFRQFTQFWHYFSVC